MEKNDSILFLEFLTANGFKIDGNILEIIQSVPSSISKSLKTNNQFLLSTDVDYEKLKEYEINGAYGYISNNRIVVPKTKGANLFFAEKNKSLDPSKSIRTYSDVGLYDSAISYHEFNKNHLKQVQELIKLNQKISKYIGFITDKNDELLEKKLDLYAKLLNALNSLSYIKYEIIHDSVSSKGKELYLIKRK